MLTLFKTAILVFIVVTGKAVISEGDKYDLILIDTGWVVLAGKTRVQDPYANFRHAFAGSSTSSNDVCTEPHFEILL